MLEMSLDKICQIILKAREFDVKVPPEEPDPGSNPSDDQSRAVLQDYKGDPTYFELKSFIDDLNEDERAQLVALMWVGRGTYEPDDWDEALAEARRSEGPGSGHQTTAGYLLGEPLLGDFLEDGLSAYDLSCEDFDFQHL